MPHLDTIDELLDRGGTAGVAMSNMNTTDGVFKWAGRWKDRYKKPEDQPKSSESKGQPQESDQSESAHYILGGVRD